MQGRRLRRALARHGPAGVVRIVARMLRVSAFLHEHHVWYSLSPAGERPRRELPAGLQLRRGNEYDLRLLEQLPTIPVEAAHERLARPAELWLVLDGEQPLFACWIFRGHTPVLAAPGGEMRLDDGVACLEDSVTSAAARGRGVAPGAWTAIADELAAQDVSQLITTVNVDNIPSRKAVEKVGFEPVALMHLLKVGPWKWTRVDAIDLERGARIAAGLNPEREPGALSPRASGSERAAPVG